MKDPIVGGHPIHAVMTDVPIGAIVATVVFDLISLITRSPSWLFAAQASVALALVSGIAAAFVGVWDYMAVPKTHPVRSIGAQHGLLNTLALLFIAASVGLRFATGNAVIVGQSLSLVALAVFGLTGWLGGEMIYKLGWRVTPAEYAEQLEADLRAHGETARIAKAHEPVDQYERSHKLL